MKFLSLKTLLPCRVLFRKDLDMARDRLHGREVIIEFHQVGAYVKVSAMDVQSLTEISIQGAANSPQSVLKNNALRRLEYVMKQKGLISDAK